jgi:hypothetical protein
MLWRMSNRADGEALPLADRHYNRQKIGSPQFMPPGRCVCFIAGDPANALWGTAWPIAQYVQHAWAGAWINSIFRSEDAGVASVLIRQAVAATKFVYGPPPELGMVTFIDPANVKPRMIRGRPTWGWTYFEAGFKHVGYTKGGLWAFQMLPSEMPEAVSPLPANELVCTAQR